MPIGGTAFLGQNQSPRLTTSYLNSLNRHGDPAPGVPVSTAQVSGSIVQPYGGFEGGKLTVTNPWAAEKSDPAVGPLYGGVYQYVKFSPLMTIPAQRGAVCFWADEPNYVVTMDYDATASYKVAGVVINETDPGNWDFIQISGIAMAMFSAAGTQGQPASVTPTTGTATLANVGGTMDHNYLGLTTMTDPVANQMSPVQLNLGAGWNY